MAMQDREAEFWNAVTDAIIHRGWRVGQAVANIGHPYMPEDFVDGSDLDPFHDNNRIEAYMKVLRTQWTSET